MVQRSEQAKLLTRSLLVQLLRDLVIFTMVFGFAAVTINTFLVPRIADFVADTTTEWREYRFDSISLLEALDVLEGDIYAMAQSEDEALALYNQEEMSGFYSKTDASVASSMVVEESEDEVTEKYRFEPGAEYGVEYSGASDEAPPFGDALVRTIWSSTFELLPAFTPEEVEAIPANTAYVLFYRLGDEPYWSSPMELRSRAISQLYVYSTDFSHNQIVYRPDSVAIRDVSLYLAIKQFKYPLAIILYLAGFVIILAIGFRRALRYFDELSAAVGSIVAHSDKPVKLSRPLRSTEDELNAIRDASLADERAAQAAEQRKDELVAYLAHDVKTPITSVIGYLSLLDEAPDIPEEQRQRYIKTALLKSERLEELIDEFFEITRYNLQAIPIERAQVGIQLFCQQVAEEFYPDAEAHKLTIAVDAPADATFFVDPDKFARALGNVVRNAITHANSETEVSIQVIKTDETIPRWRISVTDVGREISAAHLDSIFDKFYRATPARSSSDGRAGLGLAIAKEIVVAHGGSIEAASENGQTTFTIYIPV